MIVERGRWNESGRYLALAIGTIALGLLVHFGAATPNPDARDVIGDALWAAMMVWWVSAAAPHRTLMTRGAIALGISVLVELSQLLHTPALDALRHTTLGHLVLGSGFDPRDLLAYGIGVLVAITLERFARAARQ